MWLYILKKLLIDIIMKLIYQILNHKLSKLWSTFSNVVIIVTVLWFKHICV